MKYKIFNKSSESMMEIDNESINLICFSPPYNIKTSYDDFDDNLELEKYFNFIKTIILECTKKLKKDGRLIIEVADSIFTNKNYIQLAGLIQRFAIAEANLFLENRHINFINTNGIFELPDHSFDSNYATIKEAHSNCHQILVFNKSKVKKRAGDIMYINYKHSSEHPCSVPKKMVNFILKNYFNKGMKVLDPFMGTANLGVAVIKKGGNFFGYELVKKYYGTAKKKLEAI
jgi:DNA modification methylase